MMAENVIGLRLLVEDLNPVAARWHSLGVQLGLDDGELRNISGDGGRVQACFRDMLVEWMNNNTPTSAAIIAALRSPAVCYCALADQLENMEDFKDGNLKLKLLLNRLKSVTARWHDFGIQLGVDPDRLREFECHTRDVKRYLSDMLMHWLVNHEPAPTVDDLLNALKSPDMMEIRLAARLEKKYEGLDRLATDLNPVATKWKALGIELEVPQAELDAIGALFTGEAGRAQVCLRRVVLEWLNNSTKPATREVLVEALSTGAVGEKRRADLLSAPDLECKPRRLLRELRPVAARYHALGVQLGVPLATIREFETEAGGQDVKRFLREVLDQWLGNDPQLDLLVEALIEIGHRRLAESLERAYDGKELVLVVPKAKEPVAANQKTEDDSGCDSGD